MNIEKLENNIQSLVTNLNEKTFIYDLLLVYGQPKSSITRLQKGDYNLSKIPGEILWKKKLFFKEETAIDLHELIDKVKSDPAIIRHHPRFIIVTDFKTLLSVDTRTEDTLDIPAHDLTKHFDFFLPWAGMEKSQFQSENPADIKAAERMGRLYDLILEDNPAGNDRDRHALNIFLSRLLFCFFAEDTDIFADNQFTNAVASHTTEDGSDLQAYLQKLFKVLSLLERSSFPQFLQDFPYVNGGLFADEYPVPMFTAKSRKIIIECGALNWKAINPDIFGSMIQAVIHNDQRGSMGMHYTSVVNIMKVIEPLFLNDLYAELEQAGNNKTKLTKLLDRLYHLRIFDPACGSGNFLIIAYKELCKLEIEVFKRLYGKQISFRFTSKINLSQFYGIELDDFAHETAKLSLWLAEHQMNIAFKEVFGKARPTLPLQDGGHIVCGNATRLDWEKVCPKDEGYEIYILGNPPYIGFQNQNEAQKKEIISVFKGFKNFKRIDYIGCWFKKAANYIEGTDSAFAFVSTNSICQGEQVCLIWPYLFSKGMEIFFAHQSFSWGNNAKNKAKVTCIIVGLKNTRRVKGRYIYTDSVKKMAKNISPYLIDADTVIIEPRNKPISNISKMSIGNVPLDGNNFVTSQKVEEGERRRIK
ncbi:MAG TPA: class I SAM-dependent DNA methyltransferase [Nitrospirae bacterium]|nr:class I SAM-dependent DNA methyltransferase [Nitrospirota bacterium]HDZ03181.1 class I SAM-dependent DNA methyltransferase [Nitrospirota bacterium]